MRRDSGFPPYGRTRRVEGGIKAQSTRGAIGETWWSKRFIAVLESFALGSRLTRGRNYARAGQVLTLQVGPGAVTSSVQGSRPKPYHVRITLDVLTESAWRAVESALAEQALFSARLLAGEMPAQIEEVFAGAGAPLFPTSAGQLHMQCSCPDWSVPCKHIAATFYLLAEAFDADPFQILAWRGRPREQLLERLRALRSGTSVRRGGERRGGERRGGERRGGERRAATTEAQARARKQPARERDSTAASGDIAAAPVTGAASALAQVSGPELAETVDRFWVAPVPLPIRPPSLDTEVDLLLRQLPAPAPVLGGPELVQRLRTLYTTSLPNAGAPS